MLQIPQPEIVSILNQVEIGFAVVELTGEVRFANDGFCRFLGLEKSALIGQKLLPLSTEENREFFAKYAEEFEKGERDHLKGEILRPYPDGESRWLSYEVFLVRNPETKAPQHQFVVLQDITAHRKLNDELSRAKERAEQASRMKSDFLANMSHEIRTPLGAILGFTELLGDKGLDEAERTEFLNVIARNGRSLSRIVDDVLDLSKVEAGLLSFEKVPFSPQTLVSDIAVLFTERAQSKGIKLVCEISPSVADTLISDPMRIRQIVANLVSNAVKFTQTGFVKLKLESTETMVSFIVEDSGIGIGSKYLGELFQPYAQGEEALSRRHGGTGLGLFLSRKLAVALGGTLDISHTVENQGTTMVLCLPLQIASKSLDSEWKPEAFEQALKDKRSLEGIKILVIDDAADNRLLIERMLVKTGAQMDFAADGLKGVDQALNHQYDLIFMDLQMPDMDGFRATEILRENLIATPIVALTAHAIDEVRERCEHSGFSGFLTKPIDSRSLLNTATELTHPRH